jgi:hypothetical protein
MSDDEVEAYGALAARSLDLTLDAQSMAAVVANLKILRAMAAHFMDLPLDDHMDPAAVLRL